MTVLYFSWVKEKVGVSEETVDPPATVATVDDLMTWLATRSPAHASAFADRRMIKAAVDQQHSPAGAAVTDAHEVAFFPPVTGG